MDVTCHFKVTEMDLTPTIRLTKIYVGYTPPNPGCNRHHQDDIPPGIRKSQPKPLYATGHPGRVRSNDLPAGCSRCRMWSNDSSRRTAQTAVDSGFKYHWIYNIYIEYMNITKWCVCVYIYVYIYIYWSTHFLVLFKVVQAELKTF